MTEHRILLNRTLNCIEALKHSQQNCEENTLFNDLLILSHIVPNLSKETLRMLLS